MRQWKCLELDWCCSERQRKRKQDLMIGVDWVGREKLRVKRLGFQIQRMQRDPAQWRSVVEGKKKERKKEMN